MIKSGDPRVIPMDPLFAGNKQFSVNRTEVDRVDRVDRVNRVNRVDRVDWVDWVVKRVVDRTVERVASAARLVHS